MDYDIAILYGSQTGNAEDMSKRIGHKVKARGYRVLVQAIDDFPLRMLPKQNSVIFVCSTTGHGQEPENMKALFNFIRRRDLPRNCLSSLNFAVYGLGDSSYAKFNYVSKILFKRLNDCGAKPIQGLVIGDEQHYLGCDGNIYPKLEELWPLIEPLCDNKTEPNGYSNSETLPESSYITKQYSSLDLQIPHHEFKLDFVTRYNLKTATCLVNHRITSEDHFQDTRFLSFETTESIEYEPGDVCTILPTNSDENIQEFIKILNLNPDQRFEIEKKDRNYMVNYLYDFIPDGLRVYDLVKFYLDIQSVPKRSFFEFLWPLSEDDLERGKLKEFASTEGQEELYEYCVQPKRSILEVLLDFPNTVKNINLNYLFDMIPPIKPRSFSIASAHSTHPKQVQLIVGVVEYQTRLRKRREGLCSNYLARLQTVDCSDNIFPNITLRFFIKNTAFKLPQDDETPVVMIGPGLGIAPFRSFIEELASRGRRKPNHTHLYFGCRKRESDFYFRDELDQYVADNVLRLRVAFSREEPRQYVQDLLLEDSKLISRLIREENAMIYVAGNSKLPEDLRKLFEKILTSQEGDSENSNDGKSFIAQLESQGRILYDCW